VLTDLKGAVKIPRFKASLLEQMERKQPRRMPSNMLTKPLFHLNAVVTGNP
jgi:hypothetical protein